MIYFIDLENKVRIMANNERIGEAEALANIIKKERLVSDFSKIVESKSVSQYFNFQEKDIIYDLIMQFEEIKGRNILSDVLVEKILKYIMSCSVKD